MIKRFSSILRLSVYGLVLTLGASLANAQDTNAAMPTNAATAAEAPAPAATAAPAPAAAAPKDPTIDSRVADLEAYVNNGARGADAVPPTFKSNLTGSGPGHNGWMMVSTAFVLMMTLPGLALFYGGLVRRKNVLSVIAQCFGITGLVTILWWLSSATVSSSVTTTATAIRKLAASPRIRCRVT